VAWLAEPRHTGLDPVSILSVCKKSKWIPGQARHDGLLVGLVRAFKRIGPQITQITQIIFLGLLDFFDGS
jgi:hypothetical protein